MSDEAWKAIAIIIPSMFSSAVLLVQILLRKQSQREHIRTGMQLKKTDDSVEEIKGAINGNLQRQLDQRFQEGIEHERRLKK